MFFLKAPKTQKTTTIELPHVAGIMVKTLHLNHCHVGTRADHHVLLVWEEHLFVTARGGRLLNNCPDEFSFTACFAEVEDMWIRKDQGADSFSNNGRLGELGLKVIQFSSTFMFVHI